MSEIEAVLNPEFLLKLVAIETIQHYATIDTSRHNKGLDSRIELKVTVLEPAGYGQEVNEYIYELILTHVTSYQIDFIHPDNRTFEFDTDEVKLEKDKGSSYLLSFINSSVNINIAFSGLKTKLLSCNR